jgi:hypothetical protein
MQLCCPLHRRVCRHLPANGHPNCSTGSSTTPSISKIYFISGDSGWCLCKTAGELGTGMRGHPNTALSLATQGMEKVDSQGTLTLWFHENKDKNGDPSNNVYSVSNCHVLRKNTTTDYEHKGGAQRDFVRVCGVRRFQRGLDEINKAISDHSIRASYFTQEIDGLEETDETDEEVAAEIAANRRNLDDENAAIRQLETSSRCRARRCITCAAEKGQNPPMSTTLPSN